MQFLGQPADPPGIQTIHLFNISLLLGVGVHRCIEERVGNHLSNVALASVSLLSRDETLCDVLLSYKLLESVKFIFKFFVIVHSTCVLSILRMRFLCILIPNTERWASSQLSFPRIHIHGRVYSTNTVKVLSRGTNLIKYTLSPMRIRKCDIVCRTRGLASILFVRYDLC